MIDSKLLYNVMKLVEAVLKSAPPQLQKILFYFLPNDILKIVVTDGITLVVVHLDSVIHGQPHPTQVLINSDRIKPILRTLSRTSVPAAIAWFHGTMTICVENNMVTFETVDNTGGLFPDWEQFFDSEMDRLNENVIIDLKRLSMVTKHLGRFNNHTTLSHYTGDYPIKLTTLITEKRGMITTFIMSMSK